MKELCRPEARPLAAAGTRDGYPPEVAEWERRGRVRIGRLSALAGGGITFIALAAALWGLALFTAACLGGIFLYVAIGVLFSYVSQRNLWRNTRLVPYFQRKVPGPDTFFHGNALARNCLFLDAAAAEAGTTTLSSFGFADEFHGDPAVWHAPSTGIETVAALREAVRAHPERFDGPESLSVELDSLLEKLEEARRLEVSFCLHLRCDEAYTSQEFDSRNGSYY